MDNKEKKIIRRTRLTPSALQVREKDDGQPSRTITGYAILFDTPSEPLWSDGESEGREVIDPAAVTKDFLDTQDIKMTMFHDRQLILARSNKGGGTLSYEVDDKGVRFEFEAPATVDGDKALELVKRGDISGCSFAFTTDYYDENCVERSTEVKDSRAVTTYRVKAILGIYDFTLAADPAYTDTSVETREQLAALRRETEKKEQPRGRMQEQVAEMRRLAATGMRI